MKNSRPLILLLAVGLFNMAAFRVHAAGSGSADGGQGSGGGAGLACPGQPPILLDVALKAPRFQDTFNDVSVQLTDAELGFQTVRALDLPAGQRLRDRLNQIAAAELKVDAVGASANVLMSLMFKSLEELKFRFVRRAVPMTYQNDKVDLTRLSACPIEGVAYYNVVFDVLTNVDNFNAMGDLNREGLVAREALRRVQRTYQAIASSEKIYDIVGSVLFDNVETIDADRFATGELAGRLTRLEQLKSEMVPDVKQMIFTLCLDQSSDEKLARNCKRFSAYDWDKMTATDVYFAAYSAGWAAQFHMADVGHSSGDEAVWTQFKNLEQKYRVISPTTLSRELVIPQVQLSREGLRAKIALSDLAEYEAFPKDSTWNYRHIGRKADEDVVRSYLDTVLKTH